MASYYVEVFAHGQDGWRAAFAEALAREIRALGAHRDVSVELREAPFDGEPVVGLYFASAEALSDDELTSSLDASMRAGRVVFPVVPRLSEYLQSVPEGLRPINGYEWSGSDPATGLVRKVLAELGVEDRQRRAFISHKREDGLAAAEQVHDHLCHLGFEPFIDRFHIPSGQDVQADIADALEDCALLVLLETPLAHESEWVLDEVDYALSHQLGLVIFTWPESPSQLPGTQGLPRQPLTQLELDKLKGYDILTETALARLGRVVEDEYVRSMVRRRRYMLRSTEEAAEAAGLTCTPLPQWRLLVEGGDARSLLQVSPRLPTVDDLYLLDEARLALQDPTDGLLVHAARSLRASRRRVLTWAAGGRELTLLPENAVGGYWRPV